MTVVGGALGIGQGFGTVFAREFKVLRMTYAREGRLWV